MSVCSQLTEKGETIVRNLCTKKVTLILAPIALVVGLSGWWLRRGAQEATPS